MRLDQWTILSLAILSVFGGIMFAQTQKSADGLVWPIEIPVVVVKYFPVSGDKIDVRVTGDWGESLALTRSKVERIQRETIAALEEGSRYHGYKNPDAKPSLRYKVVGTLEFLEPMPLCPKRQGDEVPMTDYNTIFARIDGKTWVQQKGVKEIWIFGYHGGVLDLWESNMSSPFGDTSNSNRDEKDLPILDRTYTVYHYNYQRDTGEAVEDHLHQFEALFNEIDGRDRTPEDKWQNLLFWGKFVGSDVSHKMVPVTTPDGRKVYRCGWTHYSPNSEKDYDWSNPRIVESDIEDWRPDGLGKTIRLNADRWQRNDLKWKIYWMQNIPGADHGLSYQGKPLTNWWRFVGDWDQARRNKITLTEPVSAAAPTKRRTRWDIRTEMTLSEEYVIGVDGRPLDRIVRVEHKPVGKVYLTNQSDKPQQIHEVVLYDFAHGLPADTPFYGEGFTMLSQTAGTLGKPVDLDGLTDRGHYKLAEPKGFRTVYGMMWIASPGKDAAVLAFTSCRRFVGRFYVNAERIIVSIPTEDLVLEPGATWELEDFSVFTGPDLGVLLEQTAERLAENHPRLPWPKLPTGWCSWYCFGPSVTAEQILGNLAEFKKKLPQVRFIQIDDGYQPWMGDWLQPKQQFGGSIQEVIGKIRDAGFEPAIWVAPFVASQQSKLFTEHPDWFVKDGSDKPLRSDSVTFGGWRLGPWYMLDGTHPEAQKFLEGVFRTMHEQWGCTYFKMDANVWGAMPFGRRHDPAASSVEAYRRGMAAIRRGAGDSFLLGCNHPMWPSIGEIHGSRSSMDISRDWGSFKSIARENLSRNWQNNRLWWNDPDCLLLTGKQPESEKSFHRAATFATGGMVLSGD
ncbi:MAG: alpha-galactosidase, partial [Phycisphaerae bacterium]|nr:alpha-galactosidase [Phycisphaerae bacterium]